MRTKVLEPCTRCALAGASVGFAALARVQLLRPFRARGPDYSSMLRYLAADR
ncbi:hypothetical protein SAMN05216573_109113 [Bradyrhizobium sp. Rc3b]|nr:hypothetical protein SAMN05216573_109113 [Bradyrhizobium sp. Rc3b]